MKYCEAIVDSQICSVIDPRLFYSEAVSGLGLGLFCKIDLSPSDIWWAHNLADTRWVEKVYSWNEYLSLCNPLKSDVEKRCYVDVDTRSIVICSEPFCRVNHGNASTSNSDSDNKKNSLVTKFISAGTEIRISYEYEAIISLIWKFPEFSDTIPRHLINNENFLFSSAIDNRISMDFLEKLS